MNKYLIIILFNILIFQFICNIENFNKTNINLSFKKSEDDLDDSDESEDNSSIIDKLSLGEKIIIIISSALFVILIVLLILYIIYKLDLKEQDLKKNMITYQKHYLFQNIINEKIYDEILKEDTCSICINKFIINKSKICITPCNHIFHFYCLKKYMLDGKGNKCPNCNFNFLEVFKTIEIEPSTVEIIPIDERDNPIFYTEEVINKDSNINNNKDNDNSNNIENNKKEVVNLTQPSSILINSKSILDRNNSKDIIQSNLSKDNTNKL
jgi:hypothetical protein